MSGHFRESVGIPFGVSGLRPQHRLPRWLSGLLGPLGRKWLCRRWENKWENSGKTGGKTMGKQNGKTVPPARLSVKTCFPPQFPTLKTSTGHANQVISASTAHPYEADSRSVFPSLFPTLPPDAPHVALSNPSSRAASPLLLVEGEGSLRHQAQRDIHGENSPRAFRHPP